MGFPAKVSKPKVLFVCVENSCRSQIAEGLTRLHARESIEAYSAGSRPSGQVNPKAIESMHEKGYDLSRHDSSGLESIPAVEFDAVITMGCGDECPFVPARRREDWAIPDPKSMPAEEFRQVRDQIEGRVLRLIDDLLR